jgi:predicted PurR-regulated permease PerM
VRRDRSIWPRWGLIGLVPAIFFVGQSLGDYLLSPYLVGRRVNLNPVWLMFALFAFGYLFGFVGLLIAVPLAAAIGVLLRFALSQYYASPL